MNNRSNVVLVHKIEISNRLEVVMGVNMNTVPLWWDNKMQSTAEASIWIAKVLDVDVRELFNSTKE